MYQILETNSKDFEINPDVKFIIYQYTRGQQYGHLWDKETNLNLNYDLVIFDIKNLPIESEIFHAQIYLVLRYIETQILANMEQTKNINITVDEVHLFLNQQSLYALRKLQNLCKRVRKYKANLITGTQNLQDYLNESIKTEATALINNSNTLFIMKLKDADVNNLNAMLNKELTDSERNDVLNASRGQSLMIRGSKRGEIQILKVFS